MSRKVLSNLTAVLLFSAALVGCFLNTPDRVVRRFIGQLKDMRWDSMADVVDWPQSAQYVPGLPATNDGEDDAKKEVMMRLAENLTMFPVRQKNADQIRHEFLYLRLSRLKHTRDDRDWAWLEITVSTEKRSKAVQVLVMKINRLWRVVLTDSIFQ